MPFTWQLYQKPAFTPLSKKLIMVRRGSVISRGGLYIYYYKWFVCQQNVKRNFFFKKVETCCPDASTGWRKPERNRRRRWPQDEANGLNGCMSKLDSKNAHLFTGVSNHNAERTAAGNIRSWTIKKSVGMLYRSSIGSNASLFPFSIPLLYPIIGWSAGRISAEAGKNLRTDFHKHSHRNCKAFCSLSY